MNILKKETSGQVRERTNRDKERKSYIENQGTNKARKRANEEAEQTVEENLHMMREGGQTNIVKG